MLEIYRGVVPAKLQAGHYAAVFGNELWVFPGPRNHNMRRVYCLDMVRYRCSRALTLDAVNGPQLLINKCTCAWKLASFGCLITGLTWGCLASKPDALQIHAV